MAVAAWAITTAQATVLTSVPMQGPMVHVSIKYTVSGGTTNLTTTTDPITPVLTPLTISNPGDSFSAFDPWFGDLDPSTNGDAFNRQYGFVLDGTSDLLPTGYGIWIRQDSASPGLSAHLYRASPATWDPMFGTGGSSDTLQWNLGMFHPAYSAPGVPGAHSANYTAFVVDGGGTPTGVAENFTLTWSAVGIPEPATVALMIPAALGLAAVRRRRACQTG